MRFTLDIEMGDDAMQTPEDVAHALRGLADEMHAATGGDTWHLDAGIVRDVNGNKVGKWELVA